MDIPTKSQQYVNSMYEIPTGSIKQKCRCLKGVSKNQSGHTQTTGEYKKGQEIGDDDMICKEGCVHVCVCLCLCLSVSVYACICTLRMLGCEFHFLQGERVGY